MILVLHATNGFQSGQGNFTPRGCLGRTQKTFSVDFYRVDSSVAAKRPTIHRALPRTKNGQIHNVSNTEVWKLHLIRYSKFTAKLSMVGYSRSVLITVK